MDSTTTNQEELKKILDELRLQSSHMLGYVEQCALGGASEVLDSKISALKDIMEALTNPDINMIGLCGKDGNDMAYLLERVQRRVTRDKLFGVTVVVSIAKKPNLTRIQREIAHALGLKLDGQRKQDKTAFFRWLLSDGESKVINANGRKIYDRIIKEPSILFILVDVPEKLELERVGIPFSAAHQGCKVLLTSESDEILSNHMTAQPTIIKL